MGLDGPPNVCQPAEGVSALAGIVLAFKIKVIANQLKGLLEVFIEHPLQDESSVLDTIFNDKFMLVSSFFPFTTRSGKCSMSEPADIVSDDFWQIIAEARNESKALAVILEDQSREEMRHFYTEFQWASSQLQDAPFREYASAEHEEEDEGFSEDDMEDVADWVVSQRESLLFRCLE